MWPVGFSSGHARLSMDESNGDPGVTAKAERVLLLFFLYIRVRTRDFTGIF